MKSLGWALIQQDWCLYKKGEIWKYGQTDTEETQHEGMQGKDGHLKAKERALEQILLSPPSEETNPDTLILDF